MNFKTTLLLLILLIGVSTGMYFVMRDAAQNAETKPPESQAKLFKVAPSEIEKFTLSPQGGTRIVFERKGADWKLVEPVKASAEMFAVDSLMHEVTDLQSTSRIDLAPAMTGLNSPRYTMEFTDKAGKSHKLQIGNKSAVGEFVYVQRDDEKKADVVSAGFIDQLDKPASTYRQMKLVDVSQDQIATFTIEQGGAKLRVERAGLEWKIIEPREMPADAAAITSLLSGVTGLNAEEFVTDEKQAAAQYGLDKPAITVEFTAKPPTPPTTAPTSAPASQPVPTVVRFGRFDDVLKKNVFVSVGDGPIAKVPASSLDAFRKTPLELRDKKLIDVADPTRLTISRDVQATTQPTKKDADKTTIVLARRERKIAPVGPPAPSTAPTIKGAAVVAPSGETELETPATQSAAAPKTQPTATTAPATPESKWVLESEPKGDASDEKVQALVEAIHPLRAQKFLEAFPKDAKTAATYALTVELGPKAQGVKVWEFKVTDVGASSSPIGQFGELIFEVDRSFLEKLEGSFAKSATPPLPADHPPIGLP